MRNEGPDSKSNFTAPSNISAPGGKQASSVSSGATSENEQQKPVFQPPAINLPKGGGTIQGIGEKFQANPVTGTGSMSVPIAMSLGRSGFAPQLALSYDSGSGNSPYGLGWNIGLPQISRKTSQGLQLPKQEQHTDERRKSGATEAQGRGQWRCKPCLLVLIIVGRVI